MVGKGFWNVHVHGYRLGGKDIEITSFSNLLFSNQRARMQVGPRMNFSSAWSTNAVSICKSCGLTGVTRMEVSRRFLLTFEGEADGEAVAAFAALVHDRMTEEVYPEPLQSFKSDVVPAPVYTVPLLEEGRRALEEINREMGLAFDEEDLSYYTRMFRDQIKRDPTNVELFDLAQSNSEHRYLLAPGLYLVLIVPPEHAVLSPVCTS